MNKCLIDGDVIPEDCNNGHISSTKREVKTQCKNCCGICVTVSIGRSCGRTTKSRFEHWRVVHSKQKKTLVDLKRDVWIIFGKWSEKTGHKQPDIGMSGSWWVSPTFRRGWQTAFHLYFWINDDSNA